MFTSKLIDMKTDPVEIFQSLRACLHPYTSRGYTAHANSETDYDLWCEKNMVENGKQITERFFASLAIVDHAVEVKTNFNQDDNMFGDVSTIKIANLDNEKLKEVENLIAITHDRFKEKDWI